MAQALLQGSVGTCCLCARGLSQLWVGSVGFPRGPSLDSGTFSLSL